MSIIKKVFFILLVLDIKEIISVGIALFPTFKTLAGYGQLMLGVAIVIAAVTAAVLLFEIFAKIFLIRSTSPTFSWSDGRKGCVASAKLLWLFNLGAAIIGVLSIGGEGATLVNQVNLYIQVLASVAEMIAISFYLRTAKRLFMDTKKEHQKGDYHDERNKSFQNYH